MTEPSCIRDSFENEVNNPEIVIFKKEIARLLRQYIVTHKHTRKSLSIHMGISQSSLNRLLKEEDVTLSTLNIAAETVGKHIVIYLIE
jgi:predicted XRE-type DNA-binding protein